MKAYITVSEKGEAIPAKTITDTIVNDMIQKILTENPNVKDCLEYSKNNDILLNILDTLSYAKHQLGCANKVISLLKENEDICPGVKLPNKIKLNLTATSKSLLKTEGSTLCLDLGVESTARPFFPSQ